MSEPTDYHRKLAEAIDKRLSWYEQFPGQNVDAIAAVLASEQVVDPEGHRQLQEGWAALAALKDTAEAEVERLKAIGSDKIEAACREEVQRLMKKITTDSIEAYKEGVEDAVKIAQNDALGLGIAIAIQKLL